jgi:hypothetical protein
MTNPDSETNANKDALLQRITLMEEMIAEGRRTTARCGWVFLLWGLVDLAAISWRYFFPHSHFAGRWAWPICLIAGAVITIIVSWVLLSRDCSRRVSAQSRSVKAVWGVLGVALAIYISCAMIRHFDWQHSYVAGILMMVGMAHAISAVILRWRAQAVMAAVWWAGGAAIFFVHSQSKVQCIMFVEMALSMIAFGLYAMVLERRLKSESKNA